jgi:hypothetical protein
MKNKPPMAVTGMRWMVLFLAIWNLLRAISAILTWNTLLEFAPRPGPWYTLLTGSFWTLACFAVWMTIRRRSARAQGVYLLTVFGYIAWRWADRYFLFQQPRTNTAFAAVVTTVIVLSVILDFFNRETTRYFTQRETYDQPTNQQPS